MQIQYVLRPGAGLGVEIDVTPLRQIAEVTERVTDRAQTYFRPDCSITKW